MNDRLDVCVCLHLKSLYVTGILQEDTGKNNAEAGYARVRTLPQKQYSTLRTRALSEALCSAAKDNPKLCTD